MGKYSQHVIDDLLAHLDALDVLELIDFHPESIQRSGPLIKSFCPLCQDLGGRYLNVNAETKEFRSEPPDMPPQSGTLIDLFARCRRLDLDAAVERLADEFGIHLLEDKSDQAAVELFEEAGRLIEEARKKSPPDAVALEEAVKRLRRALELDPEYLEAQRLLVEARHLEGNVFVLAPDVGRLLEMERAAGNMVQLVEVAKRYLESNPPDLAVRRGLVDALLGLDLKDEAVAELMTLAEVAEQEHRVEEAVAAYRRVEEIAGDAIDVQPMIHGLLVSQGRNEEAREELGRRLGQLRREERYREATEIARDAVRPGPADDDLRLQVVELALLAGLEGGLVEDCHRLIGEMMDAGRLAPAAEALSYLAAEMPEDLRTVQKMVACYREMGEEDLCRELEYRLAEMHGQAGQPATGQSIVELLLERDPGDRRARQILVDLLLRQKETKKALAALDGLLASGRELAGGNGETMELLRRCMEAAPAEPGLYKRLLAVRRAEGELVQAAAELAEAVPAFREAGRQEEFLALVDGLRGDVPGHPGLAMPLARLYAGEGAADRCEVVLSALVRRAEEQGEVPAAPEEVEGLLKEMPDSPSLRLLHAFSLRNGGRLDEARKAFFAAVKEWRGAERLAEAREALQQWTALEQDDLEAFGLLSGICAELGEPTGVVDASHQLVSLLRAKGDGEAALEHALGIVELEPEDETAHRHLAELYEEAGNKEKAAEHLRHLVRLYKERGQKAGQARAAGKLLDLEPGEVEPLLELIGLMAEAGEEEGLALRLRQLEDWMPGETEKKIRLVRDWIEVNPGLPDFRKALAGLYHSAGRADEAAAEWEALIGLHAERGEQEEALRLYEEAVKQAPENISLRAGLTDALQQAGRLPEAIENYLVLARQLQKARKLEDAAAAFEEMQALDPGNEKVTAAHVALLRDMGREDDAHALLKKMASVHEEAGRPEKAVEILREVLEEEPSNHEARRYVVALLRRAGRVEDAVAELRRLAAALQEEGDGQGVLAAYRDAVALQPEEPALRQLLVSELEEQGRSEEALGETVELAALLARKRKQAKALEMLSEVLGKDPDHVAARREKARLLDKMGKKDEALEEYRALQDLMEKSPAGAGPATGAASGDGAGTELPGLEVLPEYDFDSFVVGTKNNFAYATARAVAKQPGSARNPLFLYSDVGLGKTHLLHAIANELARLKPGIRIVYGSTEYFTSELVEAIEANKTTAFRNKYRKAEVLLLDDVQFLAGKERSQEEFFHIFNMLFQARRQIVVTSDRPPKDIAHLDMRLRSRFGQGVIVDIQAPDFETRLAILTKEAKRRGVDVDEEVLEVLAERLASNVRELKGAFNQLLTLNEIDGSPLTPELATGMVEKYFVS